MGEGAGAGSESASVAEAEVAANEKIRVAAENRSDRINISDHFIYTKAGVAEIINIQPLGNKAKPYQVKQIRNLILKYKLAR